jgi:hypothetical protein
MPRVTAVREVSAGPQEGFVAPATVADDRFTIDEAPAGDYRLTATDADGEWATATVTVTANGVARAALAAAPIAHIDGLVRSWPDGEPMPGVHCFWVPDGAGRRNTSGPSPTATDAAGRFSMAVPAGRIAVNCFAPRGNAQNVKDSVIDLAPGATGKVEVAMLARRDGPPRVRYPGLQLDPSRRVTVVAGDAEATGLQVGDVVLAVDGIDVTDVNLYGIYMLLIDRHEPGSTARITFERLGVEQTAEIPMVAP